MAGICKLGKTRLSGHSKCRSHESAFPMVAHPVPLVAHARRAPHRRDSVTVSGRVLIFQTHLCPDSGQPRHHTISHHTAHTRQTHSRAGDHRGSTARRVTSHDSSTFCCVSRCEGSHCPQPRFFLVCFCFDLIFEISGNIYMGCAFWGGKVWHAVPWLETVGPFHRHSQKVLDIYFPW